MNWDDFPPWMREALGRPVSDAALVMGHRSANLYKGYEDALDYATEELSCPDREDPTDRDMIERARVNPNLTPVDAFISSSYGMHVYYGWGAGYHHLCPRGHRPVRATGPLG